MNAQNEKLKTACEEGLGPSVQCDPDMLHIPCVQASQIRESGPETETGHTVIRSVVTCEYDRKYLIQGDTCHRHSREEYNTDSDLERFICRKNGKKWCQPFNCGKSASCDSCDSHRVKQKGKDRLRYVQHEYEYDDAGGTMRKVLLRLEEKKYRCSGWLHDNYYWPWEMNKRYDASKPAGIAKPENSLEVKPVPEGNLTSEAQDQCLLEYLEYNPDFVTRRYYMTPDYLAKIGKKRYTDKAYEFYEAYQGPAPATLLVYREEIREKGSFLFFLDEYGYILDIIKDTGRPDSIIEKIGNRFLDPEVVRHIVTEPDVKLIRLLKKIFSNSDTAVDPWRIRDAYDRLKIRAADTKFPALYLKTAESFDQYIKALEKNYPNPYHIFPVSIKELFDSLIGIRKEYKYVQASDQGTKELKDFLNNIPDYETQISSELTTRFSYNGNAISEMLKTITAYINTEEWELTLSALRMKYRDWPNIKGRSKYCLFERRNELVEETAAEKLYSKNKDLATICMNFANFAVTNDPVRLMQMIFDHKQVNIFLFWLYFPYINFDVLDEDSLHTARWGKYFRKPGIEEQEVREYSLSVPKRRILFTDWEKEACEDAIRKIREWREKHKGEKKASLPIAPTEAETILFGRYAGEPIEWFVFDEFDHRLLVSRCGLEAIPLDADDKNAGWETSSLRKWLNEDFYNEAFSDEEKAEIVTLTQEDYPIYMPEFDTDSYTPDRVSIPARHEVLDNPEQRTCCPTEHATHSGAYRDGTGAGKYWIRSSGQEKPGPLHLNENGVLYANDATAKDICVRPMIWIRRALPDNE